MADNSGKMIKKYDVFEAVFNGRTDGNPFTDYDIKAVFRSEREAKEVKGFYDGSGKYVIRFMPPYEGEYEYTVAGSFSEMNYSGTFEVVAGERNHGPIRVTDRFHFSYDDGTPYYCIGTTCYVWELRNDELITETLKSLKCLFTALWGIYESGV